MENRDSLPSVTEFKAGDYVGIIGRKGGYVVQRLRERASSPSEVLVYGGTRMRERYITVTVDQIKHKKRPSPRASSR